jgi:putative heme iron utilization protein
MSDSVTTTPENPFTTQVSDRICKHMNDDHADAVLVYAQYFGQLTTATSARMRSIDSVGMDLAVEVDGHLQPLRIEFKAPLADAKAAHHVLVDMIKEAQQANHDASGDGQ